MSVIPKGKRYCKYCYQDVYLEIGPDGSIIVCTKCGSGLANIDDVYECGSYDKYKEKITNDFYARMEK